MRDTSRLPSVNAVGKLDAVAEGVAAPEDVAEDVAEVVTVLLGLTIDADAVAVAELVTVQPAPAKIPSTSTVEPSSALLEGAAQSSITRRRKHGERGEGGAGEAARRVQRNTVSMPDR